MFVRRRKTNPWLIEGSITQNLVNDKGQKCIKSVPSPLSYLSNSMCKILENHTHIEKAPCCLAISPFFSAPLVVSQYNFHTHQTRGFVTLITQYVRHKSQRLKLITHKVREGLVAVVNDVTCRFFFRVYLLYIF